MSFAPAHRCHKGLVLCSALSIGLLAACTTEAEPTGAVSGASLDSPGVEQTSDVQAEGTAADAESAAPEEPGTTEPASAAEDDVLYAEVDDPVTFEVCEEAEESEHAEVSWLDDEVIEEQEIEAVPSDSVEIDGEEVEIPGSSAIVIPERVAQGGCTIEYTAPSACLPAVEISGSFVPGYTLPGRTLPEVELPDGTVLEEMVQEEIEVAAVEHDGVFQEEVCQTSEEDAEDGDYISSVYRSSIYRSSIYQSSEYISSEYRRSVNLGDGESVPGTSMDGYGTDGQGVDGVGIDGEGLEGYELEGADHTEYYEDDDSVIYTTEGDVLFDPMEWELLSGAESDLEAIVAEIEALDGDVEITVEGHTDDQPHPDDLDGDEAGEYNQQLSEDRAQAVADWMEDHADVDTSDLTVEGYGMDHPRADNSTEEGRAENRRVVITAEEI